MRQEVLSPEIKTFIDQSITSVEELEVLLLLRAHPDKDWDAVDLAHALPIEPLSASNYLMALYLKGLLGRQEHAGRFSRFRYRAYPKPGDRALSELAAIFQRARAEVIDYIATQQRQQLQAFSNAFGPKKDK